MLFQERKTPSKSLVGNCCLSRMSQNVMPHPFCPNKSPIAVLWITIVFKSASRSDAGGQRRRKCGPKRSEIGQLIRQCIDFVRSVGSFGNRTAILITGFRGRSKKREFLVWDHHGGRHERGLVCRQVGILEYRISLLTGTGGSQSRRDPLYGKRHIFRLVQESVRIVQKGGRRRRFGKQTRRVVIVFWMMMVVVVRKLIVMVIEIVDKRRCRFDTGVFFGLQKGRESVLLR